MTNPDHQTVWMPTHPEFTIRMVSGTSTNRGYHETYYEVISRVELDADDFTRLDACGLTGMGQAYAVLKSEVVEDEVPPVVTSHRTGALVPDVAPTTYRGDPVISTHVYKYFKYTVRRICDSGD